MKKKLCLIIACCMVLTLGACTDPQDPTETTAAPTTEPMQETTQPTAEPTTEPTVEPTTEPDPVYNDSLLSELTVDSTVPGQEEVPLSFRIPQLVDDTPDAAALNELLASRIADFEEGRTQFKTIQWRNYWNGPQVSLILEQHHCMTDDIEYDAYTYDFAQGMSIENEDLISAMHLGYDDVLWMVRHAAENYYDGLSAEMQESLGADAHRMVSRAKTLSYDNLDPDSMPLYVGQNGKLHAIMDIGYTSGSGATKQDLVLEPMPTSALPKAATSSNVQAVYRLNEIILVFEYTAKGNIEPNQEYRVNGLSGVYQDMQIASLGPDGDEYLVLLNDMGRVTVCNLTQGAAINGRFYAAPLLRPFEPVEKLEKSEDGKLVFVTESGKRIDAYEEISYTMDSMNSYPWNRSWGHDTDDGYYGAATQVNEDGATVFSWDRNGEVIAGGRMVYDGMDEYGLRYHVIADPALGDEGIYQLTISAPVKPVNPDDCKLSLYQVSGDREGLLINENPAEFYEMP